MKFIKENTGKGILVSNAVLKVSGLDKGILELRVENGAVMLFKRHMTVADLLKVVDALGKTASELIVKLAGSCDTCDCCDPECLFQEPEELGDIPEELAEPLAQYGICFESLRDLMDEEVVVYGD